MTKLTERQTFKISSQQKETLRILKQKYKYNTSQFIRDAINEKLQRERNNIFKEYREIQKYLKQSKDCPF